MSFLSSHRRLLALLLGFGLVVAAGLVYFFRHEIIPEYSPAHRGAEVARSAGCFACHGPGGGRGAVKPSRGKTPDEFANVPSLLSERHTPLQLRQWIAYGISQEKKDSQAHMQSRQEDLLQMPAFGERLSAQEIEDVMAYVALLQHAAAARKRPAASPGEELARRYSCFTCHGEMGQGGVGNPGSLKGYVPGFFGSDFLSLTRDGDRQQVMEWIRDGAPESFLNQGFLGFYPVRYLTERQAIQMPAYGDLLSDEQLQTLADYILEIHDLGPLSAVQIYNDPLWSPPASTNPELGPQGEPAGAEGVPQPASGEGGLAEGDSAAGKEFMLFEQVKPILQRCLKCHGPSEQKSEYRMDTRPAALKGGEIAEFSGTPAISPGNSQGSLMIRFVTAEEEDDYNEIYPMPPKGERLTPQEIETLRRWIDQGVQWPPGAELLPPPEK